MITNTPSADWDVLGLGAVTVDDLLYVDHHPLPDEKLQVRARQRAGGGLAGTALVAAARLGARAAYCGVLGEDDLSHFTRQAFEREGVDCTPVVRRPGAQPMHSIVIVDQSTGQRSILFSRDAFVEPPAEAVTDELIARCRALFVDHSIVPAGLRAAELARARGIPVVADLEQPAVPRVLELMRAVDHLIVGIRFAERVTGEHDPAAAVRRLSESRACCVVTAGQQGCWYSEHGGEVQHVPAFAVQVVDTTGCGDVFHGAYAACLARGERAPRAIQIATAAAALKATQPGGRSGIPTRTAVDSFLREQNLVD